MTTPVTGPQYADDPRQVARWIDEEGKVQFDYLDITDVSFKGRFGMAARSDTEHDVSIGNKTFYLDRPVDMRVGDDVQIVCLNNYDLFMWGEIADIENAGEADMSIEVYIDDICPFDDVNQTNWEIQVVARPKPGIEKDVSFTEIDPSDVGPFTFTVTAGKFFPVGGQLLIKPTANRTIALLGRVLGYSGTSLTVSKTASNASISEAFDSWSVALLDAPGIGIPYNQINGLVISQNGVADTAHDLLISAGSVRDSTDSVDLILEDDIVKRLDAVFNFGTNEGAMIRATLNGSVSSAGTTVTGVGTTFLSDFAVGSTISMINGTNARVVTGVSNDTSLTISSSLTDSLSFHFRGGYSPTGSGTYWISLARRDSDGLIDVVCSSFRPGDALYTVPSAVDLLTGSNGQTYYRVLGFVQIVSGNIQTYVNMLDAAQNQGVLLSPNSDLSNAPDVFPNYRTLAGTMSVDLRDLGAQNDLEIRLLNDTETPGANMVYGTDGSGDRGWKADPAGGGGGIPTDWGLITEAVDDTEDFGTIV